MPVTNNAGDCVLTIRLRSLSLISCLRSYYYQASMTNSTKPILSQPLKVGNLNLKHRIAMAPLTRVRADDNHVPSVYAKDYYSQRATLPGTLIITEASLISPEAGQIAKIPGCYTDTQISEWRKIVDVVHSQGSYIYLQLWFLGRAAKVEEDGRNNTKWGVVSAGDIPFEGGPEPRPLTQEEIREIVQQYATAARRFVNGAGGDGVEIHGANGYMIDQFLQTNSNNRTDEYGGNYENRSRFLFEVVEAVTKSVGQDKVGLRLSPFSPFQGMRMPHDDILETFSYVTSTLVKRYSDLAYLHVIEPRISGNTDCPVEERDSTEFMYDLWTPRPFLTAGGYTPESAKETIETHENTVVAFGRYFISNPDLPQRIRDDVPFTPYNRSTFYTPGPVGYTDYEFAKIKSTA